MGCLYTELAAPLTLWVVASPWSMSPCTPPPCFLISATCLASEALEFVTSALSQAGSANTLCWSF